MLQHIAIHNNNNNKKKVVVTNSSAKSTLWLLCGLHMSDVSGLYVNAKHVSCHNIMHALIPGSPPPFYFHQSEGRAWEQGYPLPSPYSVICKYTIVQGDSLYAQPYRIAFTLNLTKTQFWNKNSVQMHDWYRHILNYL